MAVDVLITYKDADRESFYHPFAFQRVALDHWKPLADRLGLETLQRLGAIEIEHRWMLEQLLDELRVVRRHLEGDGQGEIPPETRDYMVRRIGELLPPFEQALSEWDQVKSIWI
jgi:hypothetical protein